MNKPWPLGLCFAQALRIAFGNALAGLFGSACDKPCVTWPSPSAGGLTFVVYLSSQYHLRDLAAHARACFKGTGDTVVLEVRPDQSLCTFHMRLRLRLK
jgi:hypothetical protein